MTEETYQLTPLGWFESEMKNPMIMINNLRKYMEMIDCNAIIFEDYGGTFEKVEFKKDWDDEEN